MKAKAMEKTAWLGRVRFHNCEIMISPVSAVRALNKILNNNVFAITICPHQYMIAPYQRKYSFAKGTT